MPGEAAPLGSVCLVGAAHQSPSVGLMQPWRFVRIQDADLRLGIAALVEQERAGREPRTRLGIDVRSASAAPLAVPCIGQAERFEDRPLLEIEQWRQRRPFTDVLYTDAWGC